MDLTDAQWRKSRYSSQQGACVEVAVSAHACDGSPVVAVRDSTDRSGPSLLFAPRSWLEFMASVKAGEHDLN
jgi:Domain of unknown function (DUF397)